MTGDKGERSRDPPHFACSYSVLDLVIESQAVSKNSLRHIYDFCTFLCIVVLDLFKCGPF